MSYRTNLSPQCTAIPTIQITVHLKVYLPISRWLFLITVTILLLLLLLIADRN